MEYFFISFLAGILTILAPCVLPVLPVVIGGSLTGSGWWRPFVITISLGLSIISFTLLLKVSTFFIFIPHTFWTFFSGTLLILFGVFSFWPLLWDRLSSFFHFHSGSQQFLSFAGKKDGVWGLVLIGMALGPVFASCSPVYFVILGTVLPRDFAEGFVALVFYGFGLSLVLFCIAILGQKVMQFFRWAADPHGIFKKIIAQIFIFLGVALLFGWDKDFESWVLDYQLFDVTRLEEGLLERVETE